MADVKSFDLVTYSDGSTNYIHKPNVPFTQLNGTIRNITSYVIDGIEYFTKWSEVNETVHFTGTDGNFSASYRERWYKQSSIDDNPTLIEVISQTNGTPQYESVDFVIIHT